MNQISGSWQRNLAVVWLSQFISMASFSSAYTFMPFFFRQLGVTGDEELSHYVALFSVASNLTFCIFAPIWGMVADVYGRRMMLIRANFGGALLMPLLAVITSPDLIIVHRLFLGALTGTVSAAQTLIISTTPKEHRSFALGAIASALFGGMMAGQFLGGGLVQRFGFNWTFAGSGVLLFVSGMLVLIWGRENFTRTETLRERVRSIRWRIPRFGVIWYLMVLFICLGLAREFDNPFLPQLVMEIMDHSPDALSWSGWISGFCSLAGIVSGLLLGFLAGRLPFIRVLVAAIVIAAVLRIVQSMSHHVAGLLVERSLMILAIGGVEPLFQAWLAGATPEREHGSYFGWAACAKAVGWISGAYLGGIVAGWFGTVRYVFFGSGLLFLLLVPLIVATARIVPPKIARKKRV